MTTEQLLLIDVADVRAVRINCTTCNKSTLFFHLGTRRAIEQQCKCDWGARSAIDAPQTVAETLVNAIHQWRKQQTKPPFQLQFEVSPT